MKIKPCPICGEKAHLQKLKRPAGSITKYMYLIECETCYLRTTSCYTREGAFEMWNHRKPCKEEQMNTYLVFWVAAGRYLGNTSIDAQSCTMNMVDRVRKEAAKSIKEKHNLPMKEADVIVTSIIKLDSDEGNK